MGVSESETPFYKLGGSTEPAVGRCCTETCENFDVLAYVQES